MQQREETEQMKTRMRRMENKYPSIAGSLAKCQGINPSDSDLTKQMMFLKYKGYTRFHGR
jgi:hypothetical protein